MATRAKNILPITLHTFKKHITNPWSGKVMPSAVPATTDIANQITQNYDPDITHKKKIGGRITIVVKPKTYQP